MQAHNFARSSVVPGKRVELGVVEVGQLAMRCNECFFGRRMLGHRREHSRRARERLAHRRRDDRRTRRHSLEQHHAERLAVQGGRAQHRRTAEPRIALGIGDCPEPLDVLGCRRRAQLLGLRSGAADPQLVDRLDEEGNWAQRLSIGEQQRLAFARVLLTRPEIVFLDEATSALDEAAEMSLYRLLREAPWRPTIVSVGHHGTLQRLHDTVVDIGRRPVSQAAVG